MEATEMDVEEPQPDALTNSNYVNRFALKNSIQTNVRDEYVFQIVPRDDWTSMAVSLSTNAVKLYSPQTCQYFGECNGHSSTINQIAFSAPSSTPHILHSCSSDGTIRAWDTRSYQQVSCLNAGSLGEVFCFSFGGPGDNLLAAGCKSQVEEYVKDNKLEWSSLQMKQILFWDWRTKKQIACLEESHMDDVTQVHFVPSHQNKLLTASVDGLMCIFDTGGNINDDDHLESVINVGTSIGKVGFFGEASHKLWCLTHIETLSIWDWKDARVEVNFENARSLASDGWSLDHVDYFVDCYCPGDDRLWLIGGTSAGILCYFPVNFRGHGAIGSPEAVLQGGHTGIIRSVLPMLDMQVGATHNRGIFAWTGGEDGRLCCWSSDKSSSDASRSWISSELVIKPRKTRRKSRHHPY